MELKRSRGGENPGRMQLGGGEKFVGKLRGREGRDHEGGYRVLEVTFITVRCAQFSRL